MRHLYCAWDQALANSGFACLEWLDGEKKLSYVGSHVFHPSLKWGIKSDALIFLEHQKHVKDTLTNFGTISAGGVEAIGVEGIAFAAPGQAASRGGIWAIYATMSVLYGDVVVIQPTRLKRYLAEYGFAEKEDIKRIILSKYKDVPDTLSYDEYDAIGLAEVTAYAHMITYGKKELVRKLISPAQFEIFLDPRVAENIKLQVEKFDLKKKEKKEYNKEAKKLGKKIKKIKRFKPVRLTGICDRPDDFYITKRSN